MICFGIDSSNYRSSVAALYDDFNYQSNRKLLQVDKGKRGLRQSDAVFLHTKQLPALIKELLLNILHNCVSTRVIFIVSCSAQHI